jgi:SurA N-terminal domain
VRPSEPEAITYGASVVELWPSPRRHPRVLGLIALLAGLWLASAAQAAQPPSAESCPPPGAVVGGGPPPSPPPAAIPSPPAASPIVACVGAQSITEALYAHWQNVAKRAGERIPSKRALTEEVMAFLISSEWLIGEAQELGVQVSAQQVRRRFDHVRRAQFPKRGEFRRFLRQSGQTVPDLLLRVRLDLLSTKIQRRVMAGQHGAARERALAHYVSEFHSKWSARTYCAPAYAISDCGHVQAPL